MVRLFAFFTRRKLVWLKDFDGAINLAVVYRDPFNPDGGICYRQWPCKNIGPPVLLNADGTCAHSYVIKWAPYSRD